MKAEKNSILHQLLSAIGYESWSMVQKFKSIDKSQFTPKALAIMCIMSFVFFALCYCMINYGLPAFDKLPKYIQIPIVIVSFIYMTHNAAKDRNNKS